MRPLLAIVAVFALGVMIAARLGPAMVDPLFLVPFCCLSAFVAGQSMAGAGRAVGFMASTIAVALALVNIDPPRDRFPAWPTALAAAFLSAAFAFAAAAGARWLSRKSSPAAAKWALRAAMLASYCLYRWMPGPWLAWLGEQSALLK